MLDEPFPAFANLPPFVIIPLPTVRVVVSQYNEEVLSKHSALEVAQRLRFHQKQKWVEKEITLITVTPVEMVQDRDGWNVSHAVYLK